ncbi:MAG: hypothetical protein K6G83_11155, partial [Lachnospiraceae bacterium]|nr:hypothetical protein [Lachnospiraceae bacterium]
FAHFGVGCSCMIISALLQAACRYDHTRATAQVEILPKHRAGVKIDNDPAGKTDRRRREIL